MLPTRARAFSAVWLLPFIVLLTFIYVRRAEAQKPAWKWTVEERLARRFDTAAIKARAAEEAAVRDKARSRFAFSDQDGDVFGKSQNSPESPLIESVDGDLHPELFLPSELFDDLLSLGFPPGGAYQRDTRSKIDDRTAALGFGSDFWPRLKRVTAAYLDYQQHRPPAKASPGVPEFRIDPEGRRWCQLRAETLAAAKREFGEEPFLRLLYVAVTPGHARNYMIDDLGEHERYLRYLEGGCR
jgi:hypothetical protein